jgi:hypothetical protein
LLGATALRSMSADWLRERFRTPLQFAALFTSFCAVGVLAIEQFRWSLAWGTSAWVCLWLAALWLTLAVLERWPILFGGVQVALAFAWFFGASERLSHLGWEWLEPYSLHVYGVGLGALCLAFELSRIILRKRERAAALLMPAFVPVDRVLMTGLIVGQYALTAALALWNVGRELVQAPDVWRVFPEDWYEHAYSPWAWALAIVLIGVLAIWLVKVDVGAGLVGLTVVGLALPLLTACTWFDGDQAAASAIRWGLAIAYLLGSVLLWNRHRLGAAHDEAVPTLAIRGLFLLGAVGPTLLITLIVAARKLAGLQMAGPADGVFAAMGGAASLLFPLGLLSTTLAGHGFRERLAYYLGAAGLLANAGCVGGFFLALQKNGIAFGQEWVAVDALLIAAGAAWVWSIVWTAVAAWLETDQHRPLLYSPLLTINGVLGAALFMGALAPALIFVVFRVAEHGQRWTQAAGTYWTWLAFATIVGGATHYFWTRRSSLPLFLIGVFGLTAVGVIACSVEVVWPGHSYVALMFGSGVYACGWIWGTMLIDGGPPPRWLQVTQDRLEGVLLPCVAGTVAILLGGATLFTGRDEIWSALAVILAGTACALLAYQRKSEIWAALVTPVLMLAGTIVVVHFDWNDAHFVLRLAQINLAVVGMTSLARLLLQRLLAPESQALAQQRMLPVQIALGLLLTLALFAVPMAALIIDPAVPDAIVGRSADWAGAWALLANGLAAIAYVASVRPRLVIHALALSGLMAGVLLAGLATFFFGNVEWIGHHVLTMSWTLLSLGLLIVSWSSHAQAGLGPHLWPEEKRARLAEVLRSCFPQGAARAWVTVCGAFVVLLALRAISVQPDRPYWSIANTLAVSVLIGALAIWARTPAYLYGAGLLFNIIGLLIYTAWSAHRLNAPGAMIANDEWISIGVLAQILSFAVAALACSLLERRLLARGIDLTQAIGLPYAQAALAAGVHVLAIGVGFANGLHLSGIPVRIGLPLAWVALGALTTAAFFELWRPGFQRLVRYHLYTCGLMALGLILHGLTLPLIDWLRLGTMLLAGYVLLIVVLRRVADATPVLAEWLKLRETDGRAFWSVQLAMMALVVMLSSWITLTNATLLDRLAGALALALVTTSVFLLIKVWPGIFVGGDELVDAHRRSIPCYVFLTLGFGVALEAMWAFLDPHTLDMIWLQRNAAAFTLIVAALVLLRFGLSRWLEGTMWSAPLRTLRAGFGVISIVLLLVLLAHEFAVFDLERRTTPLLRVLAVAVAVALLGIVGLAVNAALSKASDVYGVEGDRRSIYIYVAEALVVALIAHLRLNVPDILPPVLGKYWYLAVMALAFAWLALAEMFTWWQRLVLAVPFRRTAVIMAIVPVIAFRLGPIAAAGIFDPLRSALPGLDPFLRYLKLLSEQNVFGVALLPMESLCWLLLGIFLGTWARLRQSANLGVFAALAINFGAWVLLDRQGATGFVQRPQLWLIPLGLIILVAEYVNRHRLGFWPSLAVRYSGLLCIYLSSTMEMFMEGLGNVLFAIVLALLAVIGVMLGILFRVRAFMLSGFLALLIVIFGQIWHAAYQQGNTWVWWASGIVLGVLILVMFALFEKHRNEVVKVVDTMKRWH